MNNKTDFVKFVDFQKFYYVFNEEYLKVAREFLPEMKKELKYCNLTAFPVYNPEKKECFFFTIALTLKIILNIKLFLTIIIK